MCLYVIKQHSKIEKLFHEAQKDITVYKKFELKETEESIEFLSPYFESRYELGKSYHIDYDRIINGAVNSDSSWIVNNGIHAYRTKKRALYCSYKSEVIIPCIIPKGSLYMLGKFNEIVSDTIKMPKNFEYNGFIYYLKTIK